MKRTFLALLLLAGTSALAASDAIYLPNIPGNASGVTSGGLNGLGTFSIGGGGQQTEGTAHVAGAKGVLNLCVRNDAGAALDSDTQYIPCSTDSTGALRVNSTEQATAADGAAEPAVIKVVGGSDGSVVKVFKTDAFGRLETNVITSALPTGAATSVLQTAGNTTLSTINTTIGTMSAKLPLSVGAKISNSSLSVVLASDHSTIPVSVAGVATSAKQDTAQTTLSAISTNTSNIATQLPASVGPKTTAGSLSVVPATSSVFAISASALPLPTGAATEATLVTAKNSLATIDTSTATTLTYIGGMSVESTTNTAALAAIQTSVGNTETYIGGMSVESTTNTASLTSIDTKLSSQATAAKQDTGNTSLDSIDTKLTSQATAAKQDTGNTSLGNIDTNTGRTPRNANATDSTAAVATGAAEAETAPADAVGFFLQADDANTDSIRWRAGGTASGTAGHELQPGRDTGFIPMAADLSIFAVTGSQTYELTWVRR